MSSYRADIDGLRAIAVLSVILFHCDVPFTSGGFVGVDVFFVISGYLITQILSADIVADDLSLVRFYDRRIRRILPAMTLVVTSTLVAGYFILTPDEFSALGESALYSFVSLANVYFNRDVNYFESDRELLPLLHLWSLGVEEQFYLFWPLLLLALTAWTGRRKAFLLAALFFLAAASFLASVHGVSVSARSAFFLPHTRAWELGLGALLALAPSTPMPRWFQEATGLIGLGLIVFSVMTLAPGDRFPGFNALAPCAGAALVIWRTDRTVASRAIGTAPARFVGKISYSLYLWHWPVLILYLCWTKRSQAAPTEAALLMVVSFFLACASWRYVEQPFRACHPNPGRLVTAVALSFTVILCTISTREFPERAMLGLTERLIVREQLYRARVSDRAEIGFFGDSSCLTGIHPPTLRERLGIEGVESFCMFGSAGPVADARAITLLRRRSALPRIAVIMMHPAQFARRGVSREWMQYVESLDVSIDQPAPDAVLTGEFAGHYQVAAHLIDELRTFGSLVDNREFSGEIRDIEYRVPESFAEHLQPLSHALGDFDRRKTYLILAPVPDDAGVDLRKEAELQVAAILGIPESNILPAVSRKSRDRFATFTHLNATGRLEYSVDVARILRDIVGTLPENPVGSGEKPRR